MAFLTFVLARCLVRNLLGPIFGPAREHPWPYICPGPALGWEHPWLHCGRPLHVFLFIRGWQGQHFSACSFGLWLLPTKNEHFYAKGNSPVFFFTTVWSFGRVARVDRRYLHYVS